MAKAAPTVRAVRPPVAPRPTSAGKPTPRSLRSEETVRPFRMPFEGQNVKIILLGVLTITAGYLLMKFGGDPMGFVSLSLAPIILVIGYCIVIPYGIMYGAKSIRKVTPPSEEPPVASL